MVLETLKDKQLLLSFETFFKKLLNEWIEQLVSSNNSYITIGPLIYIHDDLLRRSQVE